MKHRYSGIAAANNAHVRSAALHQKAISHRPLSEFSGVKVSTDALVGPYLRAVQTHNLLRDVATDAEIARRILDGTAHPQQEPLMEFTQLAFEAKDADPERKDAALSAITMAAAALANAVTANLSVLRPMLDDARHALVKAVAANGLQTSTLRHANNAGLQLLEGTIVYQFLPSNLIHGAGGLTAQGEQTLANQVMDAYLRQLEDEAILRDEFAEHDKRVAKRALEQRARQALANLGVL